MFFLTDTVVSSGARGKTRIDSRGAFRSYTLAELRRMGTISRVQFGLLFSQSSPSQMIIDEHAVEYHFANNTLGNHHEQFSTQGGTSKFAVTCVFEAQYVIDQFILSTDELVSLDKSSLLEFTPPGSNTIFNVQQLLALMKALQLNEVLLQFS